MKNLMKVIYIWLSFTIMENHAHFLISYEKIEDVSNCMHKINQTFAQMYNKIEDRVGYVLEIDINVNK